MGLYIPTPTMTRAQAEKYTKDHVIITKRDIRRIRALAKKHGLFAELKALGVQIYPIELQNED